MYFINCTTEDNEGNRYIREFETDSIEYLDFHGNEIIAKQYNNDTHVELIVCINDIQHSQSTIIHKKQKHQMSNSDFNTNQSSKNLNNLQFNSVPFLILGL